MGVSKLKKMVEIYIIEDWLIKQAMSVKLMANHLCSYAHNSEN